MRKFLSKKIVDHDGYVRSPEEILKLSIDDKAAIEDLHDWLSLAMQRGEYNDPVNHIHLKKAIADLTRRYAYFDDKRTKQLVCASYATLTVAFISLAISLLSLARGLCR